MSTPPSATGSQSAETNPHEYAIELRDVERRYHVRGRLLEKGREIEAVRGVTLAVARGSIFGVLGPNGAGKTTTVRILATLLMPTGGSARVLGHDVVREVRAVRKRIGVVFGGDRGLYDRLSARDNLRYFGSLYGLEPRQLRQRIDELIEVVGLQSRDRDRVEGYSRGMRQRLHLARGLLHGPEVLLLDEPTIGIDPVGAKELRDLVRSVNELGTTILITTHYMHEAELLCDRVAVLVGGRVVAEETPAGLAAAGPTGTVLEVEVFGAEEHQLDRIRGIPGVESLHLDTGVESQMLLVQVLPGADCTRPVLDALESVRVGRVMTRTPTLEDAYIAMVTAAR